MNENYKFILHTTYDKPAYQALSEVSWVLFRKHRMQVAAYPALFSLAALIAIILIVRTSARAQSIEDAQQGAVFLILPIILLCVSQFGGIFLINSRILLGLGILCAVLAWVFLKRAAANFTYESLNALI